MVIKMTEKEILPSVPEKVKEETKKDKLLKNIPTDKISEQYNLICDGENQVNDKIRAPKEPEQKYKTWIGNDARRTNKKTWRTRESTKEISIHMGTMEWNDRIKWFKQTETI